MALLVPDEGEVKLLELALKTSDLALRLYVNNHAPAEGDTWVGNEFTEMSTSVMGYAAKTITASTWSATTAAGVSTATISTPFTFSFTGTGTATVYGYYVTYGAGASTKILWAEALPSPQYISNNGDSIQVTLNFSQA